MDQSASRVVMRDPPDSRDLYYRPALRPLEPQHWCKRLFQDGTSPRNAAAGLRIEIRDQGKEGTCTGQALGALIDILRDDVPLTENVSRDRMASARMLFEMAKSHEPASQTGEIYSLRAVLKGFYHNGACPDCEWHYVAGKSSDTLNVSRAEAAKHLTLGAYYRLRPLLNDYHAALSEVGVILSAAHTHRGWSESEVAKGASGKIKLQPAVGRQLDPDAGGHAFLIVGYDREGFLVLNSWGAKWGRLNGLPGVAHWAYQDWAQSIMDAWVVQLAVPTPGAFGATIGAQGMSTILTPLDSAAVGGSARAAPRTSVATHRPSTPRALVLGRYAHFEDGRHYERGSYPSTRDCVEASIEHRLDTRRSGGSDDYDQILLWIEGGTAPTEDVMAAVYRSKEEWWRERVFSYHVVWCSDFVQECQRTLIALFDEARAATGTDGPYLDRRIETTVNGIGRAFWRDIKRAAECSTATPDSDASHLLIAFARLASNLGWPLHIVAEGAGAIMLARFVRSMRNHAAWQHFLEPLRSVGLVYPATRTDDFKNDFGPLIDRPGGDVRLYVPSITLEQSMRVGVYGQSLLHLVSNAFEDRIAQTRSNRAARSGKRQSVLLGPPLLGMAQNAAPPSKRLKVFKVTEFETTTPSGVLAAMHGNWQIREMIKAHVTGRPG